MSEAHFSPREVLSLKAPITPELVAKAGGWHGVPDLSSDSTRSVFFALWALLAFEWAEAMMEENRRRT